MARPTLLLAGLLAAASLAGCGTVAATPPVAATPATSPATSPATTPPGEGAPAATGPTFGFVHAVDASAFPMVVVLDEARWFAGEDAVAAARADGHDEDEAVRETGWYVRNERQDRTRLTAVGNVVIRVVEADGSERVLTPREWEERIRAQAHGEGAFFEPYHLTLVDGEVVEVRSQPMPLA